MAQGAASGGDDRSQMISYLNAGLNKDGSIRRQAEQVFITAEQGNPGAYYQLLSDITKDPSVEMDVRQLAGLNTKNGLDAKNAILKQQKKQRWLQLPEAMRLTIKGNLLSTLEGGANKAATSAAQAIAAIAAVELPERQFGSIIINLVTGISKTTDDGICTTAITCLGYICSELQEDGLSSEEISAILEAVAGVGMREGQPVSVAKAATEAFGYLLPFAGDVFTNDQQRPIVMGVLLRVMQHADADVRLKAYEALATVARLYYDNLSDSIQSLYSLTTKAVSEDPAVTVRSQAVEFWNVVSETELQIQEELREGPCHNIILTALENLVAVVQYCLKQQSEDEDDTTPTVAVMAGVLLKNMAQLAGPQVLARMMGFIDDGFAAQDWRQREASTLALGALLQALGSSVQPDAQLTGNPNSPNLATVAATALPTLLKRLLGPHVAPNLPMGDDNLMVRDTSMWVVGIVADAHFDVLRNLAGVTQPGGQPNAWWGEFLQIIQGGLGDEPRVAVNACYVLHNVSNNLPQYDGMDRNMLSGHYNTIIKAFFDSMDANDDEQELTAGLAEASIALVENAPETETSVLLAMMPLLIERLDRVMAALGAPDLLPAQRMGLNRLMVLYTGIVQTLVSFQGTDVLKVQHAGSGMDTTEKLMTQLMAMTGSSEAAAQEEAYMCILTIADALDEEFQPYVQHVSPKLHAAISNFDEDITCAMAINVLGAVCRACGAALGQQAMTWAQLLASLLPKAEVPVSVKTAAVSALGEVATVMGVAFEPLVSDAMTLLSRFHAIQFPEDDEDEADQVNAMRTALFEAYVGIAHAFSTPEGIPRAQVLLQFVPSIVQLMQQVYTDSNKFEDAADPGILKQLVGLAGDLAQLLGQGATRQAGLVVQTPQGQQSWLAQLLQAQDSAEKEEWAEDNGQDVAAFDSAVDSEGSKLQTSAAWALSVM